MRIRAQQRRNAIQTAAVVAAHEGWHGGYAHRAGKRIDGLWIVVNPALTDPAWGCCELEGDSPDIATVDRIAMCAATEARFGPAPESERAALVPSLELVMAGAIGSAVALGELHLGGEVVELLDPECRSMAGMIYGSNHADAAIDWHLWQLTQLLVDCFAGWDALRRELLAEVEIGGARAHEILSGHGVPFGGYTATPWKAAA